MKICGYQFQGSEDISGNTARCVQAVKVARDNDANLLILPEAAMFLREHETMPTKTQTLDGQFVRDLSAASREYNITIVAGMFEPSDDGRAYNTLIVLQNGRLLTYYRKLHLYDAFAVKESERIVPGNSLPPVFTCADVQVGLMTCYDIRFPEQARYLAIQGAELLAIPTAWFVGEHKRQHWKVLTTARALENGVYVAGVDMCGTRLGFSRFVDPMGICRASLAQEEGFLYGEVDRTFLQKVRHTMPLLSQRRFAISPQF